MRYGVIVFIMGTTPYLLTIFITSYILVNGNFTLTKYTRYLHNNVFAHSTVTNEDGGS